MMIEGSLLCVFFDLFFGALLSELEADDGTLVPFDVAHHG